MRCSSLLSLELAMCITWTVAAAPPADSQPARVLPAGQTQRELAAYLLGRIPAFEPPNDAQVWASQAESLRRRVVEEVVFKGVPSSWRSGEVKIVWGDELEGDGYVIRKLRYEAVPGLWCGGLLYEPAALKKRVPAVLCVNGHVGAPGMTIDYEQIKCINLAKRGIITLHPEWIGMGQLQGSGYGHGDLAWLDLCGVSGLSVFYQSLSRALDVLLAHAHTDPDRLAVTGLSGGGWQTILISALDTRVKLSAPNAGYIGLRERLHNQGDIGDLEQNPTDLVSIADYPWLTALLAPRPALLIYNEKDDCCFASPRARQSIYEPVRPFYALLGHPDRFAFHNNTDPGTHNYDQDNRQAFYRFFNRQLLPSEQWHDDEIPAEREVRKQEQLAIDYPPDNGSFHTLARDLISALPRTSSPSRAELRSVLRWERGEGRRTARESGVVQVAESMLGQGRYILRPADRSLPAFPLALHVRSSSPTRHVAVLADTGRPASQPIVDEWLGRDAAVAVVDLLFTGECQPDSAAWQWAQMIGTTGDRPLRMQVAQLSAALRQLGGDAPPNWHANGAPRVVAVGRVSSLAALVLAALEPDAIGHLEIRGLEPSFQHVLANKVSYQESPSIFCFGLLQVADVPDLVRMASPTEVRFAGAE